MCLKITIQWLLLFIDLTMSEHFKEFHLRWKLLQNTNTWRVIGINFPFKREKKDFLIILIFNDNKQVDTFLTLIRALHYSNFWNLDCRNGFHSMLAIYYSVHHCIRFGMLDDMILYHNMLDFFCLSLHYSKFGN